MSDENIISFEKARDDRTTVAIHADEAQWQALSDRLLVVMMETKMHNSHLIAATILALFDALQRSRMSFDEAETEIKKTISAFSFQHHDFLG
jgi:hypothetical protein